jgi:hypothetical protein
MAIDVKTLTVPPESDVARPLQDAVETQATIESRGVRYRVIRAVDDPFAGYDAEGVREALRQSAGAFAGLDVEAFKAEIREQRAQDSQGRPA